MTGSQLDQTLSLTAEAIDRPDDSDPVAVEPAATPSARFVLREVTSVDHLETEAAFAPFDIAEPDDYRRFLLAHAMVLPRFELGVTGQGWRDWHPRLPYLADDLAALGEELPVAMLAPAMSPVAAWGVQYVLEGSRLGGKLLARRLPEGAPSRYLRPHADMSVRWQAFCAALDAEASRGGARWMDEVTDSAKETFRAFRRSAETLAGDHT